MSVAVSRTRALYAQLAYALTEIANLAHANALMGWDQQVLLPSADGATEARGKAMATLAGVVHQKATDPALGAVLAELQTLDLSELNPYERANVRLAARDFGKNVKLPESFVREMREHSTLSHMEWVKARKADDFASFAPVLSKTFDFARRYAQLISPERAAYDTLVSEYERNLPAARIAEIFSQVREQLVPMIHAINSADHPDSAWLNEIHWDVTKQEELCKYVAEKLGFDFTRGRLDVSVHPFTSGTGPFDVRITTRYSPDNFAEGILGNVHEVGHGLAEMGVNTDYMGLPASEILSLGVHESQSLFWENFIGRSLPFWEWLFPKVKELFPSIPADKTAKDLYTALNVARPGLIRVDSDEVHYPMHVILRWELETELLAGRVAIADLPKLWDDRMESYVGARPPSAKDGVLQDVHWAEGLVGYFPTYLVGQIIAAQWNNALRQRFDLDDLVRRGEFAPILDWLRENVHRKGSVPESSDALVREALGEGINPKYLIDHLKAKYSALYSLEL
ncbi:hypothetical protein H9P43_003598 [Blastocladiella emersonii ATCC 22665]|nr:hypothetical protein H9P43_003598 [Blastocladiella emersonii ATCC 22665]